MDFGVDKACAQHYVECIICGRNAVFHCNTCGDKLCYECKIKHLKSNASNNHTVVLYQEKVATSVKEMCIVHPECSYDICCGLCEVPVCSKCIKEKHQGHKLDDMEIVYKSIKKKSDIEITRIKNVVRPLCQKMLIEIKNNTLKCERDISEIRNTMTVKARSIKDVVDEVLAENIKLLETMENSLISELQKQEQNMNSYIDYLQEIAEEYEKELRSTKTAEFILVHKSVENLKQIPERSDVDVPYFFDGQVNEDAIVEMFGEINMTTLISSFRDIDSPQKLFELAPSATQISACAWPGGLPLCCFHVSCLKSGKAWLSDNFGDLVLIDDECNKLQQIQTAGGHGYHSVTEEDELLYIDSAKNAIYKRTKDMRIQTFKQFNSKKKPLCIYSCRLNGDIIVGLDRVSTKSITKYNRNGKKLCKFTLQDDIQPRCVVKNRNNDIIVSNQIKVLALNSKGKPRFTYTGYPPGSDFQPFGIVTDVLGNILVCDESDGTIHILDHNGNFLSYLSSADGKITDVMAIGIDNDHNAWLSTPSSLIIYKYLRPV